MCQQLWPEAPAAYPLARSLTGQAQWPLVSSQLKETRSPLCKGGGSWEFSQVRGARDGLELSWWQSVPLAAVLVVGSLSLVWTVLGFHTFAHWPFPFFLKFVVR